MEVQFSRISILKSGRGCTHKLRQSMETRPIEIEADYKAALEEIEGLMSAEAGSPEGDRLDGLVTLVEAYERLNGQAPCQNLTEFMQASPWADTAIKLERENGLPRAEER